MHRPLDVLQRQILLTLAYSQVFNQPLSRAEIKKRLIYPSFGKFIFSEAAITTAIAELQKSNVIRRVGQYWQLSSVPQNLSQLRKKRTEWSEKKLLELQPFLEFAQRISWVKGVAITGSVSMRNAEEKDDVDLMIVVQHKRLWLVRPLLVLFSFLRGKRRSWNHEEYNSWCLNLWLDEASLQVQPASRSLYVAYEVCQAEWVISKVAIEKEFLNRNDWVREMLPFFIYTRLKGFNP